MNEEINYGNRISIRRNAQGNLNWIEISLDGVVRPILTCSLGLWKDFTPEMRDGIIENARNLYG